MKATSGSLRVDQSYEMISTYTGVMICENCGNRLSNVAIVKGSEDGEEYHIGLDCASTLTGITPDRIKQAKKNFANRRKILKAIENKEFVKAFVINKKMVEMYSNPNAEYGNVCWLRARGGYEALQAALENAGTEIIFVELDKE